MQLGVLPEECDGREDTKQNVHTGGHRWPSSESEGTPEERLWPSSDSEGTPGRRSL